MFGRPGGGVPARPDDPERVREGNCRNRTNVKLITPVPRDDWNIVGSPLEFRRF